MFSSGGTTAANTSIFAQATPINQNRTGSSFLFGNTTTQPSALTSTPLSSSNVFGASTPAATPFQLGSVSGTGTTQKFDPVLGTEKISKNNTQTTVKTKLMNICGMPFYEKKSMEELRLEDYNDKRKHPSTTSSLFSSGLNSGTTVGTTPSAFGGSNLTTNTTGTTAQTGSLFGGLSNTTTPAFSASIFGNPTNTTTTTAAPTATPFSFGGTAATTTAPTTSAPFAFGSTTATTSTPFAFGSNTATTTTTTATNNMFSGGLKPAAPAFSFGGNQTTTATSGAAPIFGSTAASATTTVPTFTLGGSSLFPTSTTSNATTNSGNMFNFSTPASTTSTNIFGPSATTTTSTFPLFSNTQTSTSTVLNPATNTTPALFSPQPSVDTRTHLQLFQTMLNIQPFNSEMAFLAKNIKPNLGLDRNRLRTAPESAPLTTSIGSVFSPLLTKPSVLASTTSTPPSSSSLSNSVLPNHAHTLPTVLLPSSSTIGSTTSLNLFGKRKLADSFLDDDDDNALMVDDGPSTSIAKLPKSQIVKRPRVLDMNKIRSVVLGGGSGFSEISRKGEENPSETFIVKSLSTTDQPNGWKKFANYDAYLASKKSSTDSMSETKVEKSIPVIKNKIDKDRAFHLPRLTHLDYYTRPRIDELRNYFNKDGQCFIQEFTVGREHYGSVTFRNPKLNLAGLDLNRLIEIGRRQVTVYPDDQDKPIEGEEFNCPAEISLLGVYPIDRTNPEGGVEITDPNRLLDMNYGSYLQQMTQKFQGHFINYDVHTGTWQFRVDHF